MTTLTVDIRPTHYKIRLFGPGKQYGTDAYIGIADVIVLEHGKLAEVQGALTQIRVDAKETKRLICDALRKIGFERVRWDRGVGKKPEEITL